MLQNVEDDALNWLKSKTHRACACSTHKTKRRDKTAHVHYHSPLVAAAAG